MTKRPLRPCKKCKKATDEKSGVCLACAPSYVSTQKVYDQKRGSPSKRGYDAAWKREREAFLRARPLCQICLKEGRVTPAEEVHHIKPLNEGGERLEWTNLQGLCKSCHTKITNKWRVNNDR